MIELSDRSSLGTALAVVLGLDKGVDMDWTAFRLNSANKERSNFSNAKSWSKRPFVSCISFAATYGSIAEV